MTLPRKQQRKLGIDCDQYASVAHLNHYAQNLMSSVLYLTMKTRSIILLDGNKTSSTTINYLVRMNREVKYFVWRGAQGQVRYFDGQRNTRLSVFLDNGNECKVEYFTQRKVQGQGLC